MSYIQQSSSFIPELDFSILSWFIPEWDFPVLQQDHTNDMFILRSVIIFLSFPSNYIAS